MVSLARNAADVVTSIESRLVANAVAGAHRARRGRMADSGAHLVDNMLPKAPYRVGAVVSVASTHAVCGAARVARPCAGCVHPCTFHSTC